MKCNRKNCKFQHPAGWNPGGGGSGGSGWPSGGANGNNQQANMLSVDPQELQISASSWLEVLVEVVSAAVAFSGGGFGGSQFGSF